MDVSAGAEVGAPFGAPVGGSVGAAFGATVVQAGGRGVQGRSGAVSALNVVLWVGGVALVGAAYVRGVPYWRRYQAMRAQQDNIRRYETWRGRPTEPGPSSADLMETELRRRAQPWLVAGIVGIVMIVAGFAVR